MTRTEKPVSFLSRNLGDIVISVGDNEYPIYSIVGTEITNLDYGSGSHEATSIRCNVVGNLKLGSYLTPEQMKSFRADTGDFALFKIEILGVRTYHNCSIRSVRPRENSFEFSGHC